jgi:hypothetical protein
MKNKPIEEIDHPVASRWVFNSRQYNFSIYQSIQIYLEKSATGGDRQRLPYVFNERINLLPFIK